MKIIIHVLNPIDFNYKYYKFNIAMKNIVESSYSNNLKYEPIFIK